MKTASAMRELPERHARLRAAAFALATMALAAGAQADCSGVIDALELARKQPRVAQLLVDEAGHPNGLHPVTLRIDDLIHENFDGIGYATRRAEPADPLAAALRGNPASARCERLGTGTFAGTEVVRLRFVHPDVEPQHNPVTVLVARDGGLPVFHTYAGLGSRGFVWIYGSAVREPHTQVARS